MKHMELHILQSVPISCLNRDDLNSPKTAIFGGVQRARVSSQCWKRAIREMAKNESQLFKGERTRLIIEPLKGALIGQKYKENDAQKIALEIGEAINDLDLKKKDEPKIKTLFFTSKGEIEALAKYYKETENPKKAVKKLASTLIKDAADIALFGRMVANDASLNIEGAAVFSHALSTHKADNEIDFFTAVDDLQKQEDAGAGMMGTLEFNSATYYRFAALNLDMLADETHLSEMTQKERKEVVLTFVKSTLMAMPGARKGSMNGNTLPGFVLCVIREKGHPIQLVNAFEKPVRAADGKSVFELSAELLKKEYEKLKNTWALDEKACIALPEKSLQNILDEVTKHVS